MTGVWGMEREEFAKRRANLGQLTKSSIFVFPAALEFERNPDVHFLFRQESNFYYLSGFEEPKSCLVLKVDDLGRTESHIFLRERDPHFELWEGELTGVDRACERFGFDRAWDIRNFEEKMNLLLSDSEKIYYRLGKNKDFDQKILGILEVFRKSKGRSGSGLMPIYDPIILLGELRVFKSDLEIKKLKQACHATVEGHRRIQQNAAPGRTEFEMETVFLNTIREFGCKREGYGAIVAAGANSTCLHYRENNKKLEDGQLLLVDAGGEFDYYTSDVTHTFAVTKPSVLQKKIYELVWNTQKKILSKLEPGMSFPVMQSMAYHEFAQGLSDLGLKINSEECVKKYYPHGIGHWLGMDVHDVGSYQMHKKPRVFEPGMVLTVEPGLYFPKEDESLPKEWRGIGVRIEDDILITESGFQNLTEDLTQNRFL